MAFLVVLAASSVGTGVALLPWMNRRRGNGGTNNGGGGDVPPSGPVPTGSAPTDFVPKYDVPVETDVAAPLDYMTAEEIKRGA